MSIRHRARGLIMTFCVLLSACGAPTGTTNLPTAPTLSETSIQPIPTPAPQIHTSARRPKLGELFSIQGGQTMFVDAPDADGATALIVRFASLPSDSRCPRLVNCVQAGDATITLVAQLGEQRAPQTFQLHTSPPLKQDQIDYEGYNIRLVALDPVVDRPGDQLDLSQYTAKLLVSKGGPPELTATPVQTARPNSHNNLNACTLVAIELLGEIAGPALAAPTPTQTQPFDGQECVFQGQRAAAVIRFYLGDETTARAIIAELQHSGAPIGDLTKDTIGMAAFGQNQQQATMLKQRDGYILSIAMIFGAQSQAGDHKQAQLNLETLHSIALTRYAAGAAEQLSPTPTAPAGATPALTMPEATAQSDY